MDDDDIHGINWGTIGVCIVLLAILLGLMIEYGL